MLYSYSGRLFGSKEEGNIEGVNSTPRDDMLCQDGPRANGVLIPSTEYLFA